MENRQNNIKTIFKKQKRKIDPKLKRLIWIQCDSEEEMLRVKENIHNQLTGNEDYINCNIILNGSDDRMLSEDENDYENEVHVYIFNECKYVPPITIF